MRYTSLAIALLILPSFASAQAVRDRARTWEVGLQVVDTSSETLSGEQGSGLSVGSQTGWGISGGYNFTNRLAVYQFDPFCARWRLSTRQTASTC